MAAWRCRIGDCDRIFEEGEALLLHQAREHDRHECQICGSVLPDGYIAIRHAFDEHTRAEYVRAYDADSEAVREREKAKETVESEIDLRSVFEKLDASSG